MTPLRAFYVRTSQASVLLPIVAGLACYKRLTLPFRLFLYFFIVALGFEIQAPIAKAIYRNNMPGQHLFTPIELLAFSMVYYLHFKEKSIMRLLITINVFIAVAIALLDACRINGIWAPNSVSISYSSASIIIYTLVYFYILFQKDEVRYSWEYPMFWVCSGALLYFAGNLFYFMLKRYLLHEAAKTEVVSLYVLQALNIIAHFLYAKAFTCFRKQEVVL